MEIPRLMAKKSARSASLMNGSVPESPVVFAAAAARLLAETPGLRAEKKAVGTRRARMLMTYCMFDLNLPTH